MVHGKRKRISADTIAVSGYHLVHNGQQDVAGRCVAHEFCDDRHQEEKGKHGTKRRKVAQWLQVVTNVGTESGLSECCR